MIIPGSSLNPDIKKVGALIFDVARNHHYKLSVSGGVTSFENALIQLTPK